MARSIMTKKPSRKAQKSTVKAENIKKDPDTKETKKRHTPEGIVKDAEYHAFVEWIGKPSWEREPKSQKDLAILLRVEEATLSDWKRRKGFWDLVEKKQKKLFAEKNGDVLGALYRNILSKGGGKDVLVWLQYVMSFNPKVRIDDTTPLSRKITKEEQLEVAKALKNVGLASVIKNSEVVEETDDDDDSE